jgi:hypothetical protein
MRRSRERRRRYHDKEEGMKIVFQTRLRLFVRLEQKDLNEALFDFMKKKFPAYFEEDGEYKYDFPLLKTDIFEANIDLSNEEGEIG